MKIGLWTSGWDQAAIDLVKVVYQNFPLNIAYVFLSREERETICGDLMIRKVRELGLPLITFSSLRFKPELRKKDQEAWRLEHDEELMELLPPTDFNVLLGYMWWLSEEMCRKRTAINLHPALPTGPKGTYRDVIWQLIKERAKETGVMIHLVTPELDRGPAITFCRFLIRGGRFDPLWQETEKRLEKESLKIIAMKEGEINPLFAIIRWTGVVREFPMIIRTIKVLLEGRVKVENGQIVNAEGQVLADGYDLTEEINAIVKEKGV